MSAQSGFSRYRLDDRDVLIVDNEERDRICRSSRPNLHIAMTTRTGVNLPNQIDRSANVRFAGRAPDNDGPHESLFPCSLSWHKRKPEPMGGSRGCRRWLRLDGGQLNHSSQRPGMTGIFVERASALKPQGIRQTHRLRCARFSGLGFGTCFAASNGLIPSLNFISSSSRTGHRM
jgi:hypothetical protein